MIDKISIVLPVYNEEEGIQETIKRLVTFMDSRQELFEIVFVLVIIFWVGTKLSVYLNLQNKNF